jgi:hypothetical protein
VIFAAAIERASGAWPMCQSPVPAESTVNLFWEVLMLKYLHKGDRQIFPKQTIKIFRHNVFRALIFMNIFDKFFELLIGSNRLSTVLQACNTVAWSRSLFGNMFAKEAL